MKTAGLTKWTLWEQGTLLRGANIHQRRVYPILDGTQFLGPGPVGPPCSQEDFDRLSDMGANYVHISHPGLFTENPPYMLDQNIKANLDTLLFRIENADMFAVIGFRTGPGRSEFTFFYNQVNTWFDSTYLNDTVWGDSLTQEAWADMWQTTAELYKDNPVLVGYDLMVSPNSNDVGNDALHPFQIWRPDSFYSVYESTLFDWNQMVPGIVERIRDVDSNTPILIGCMNYGNLKWLPYLKPVIETRILYTFHQYEPHIYTHQDSPLVYTYPGFFDADQDGQPEQFDQQWIEQYLGLVDTFQTANPFPIAASEYGVKRWVPDAADFIEDQLRIFEQKNVNHAVWYWHSSWPDFNPWVDAFNFLHGPDPENNTDIPASSMIEVIRDNWAKNTIRPSSFQRIIGSPDRIILEQNYPNPFNEQTAFRLYNNEYQSIEISIYNILGQKTNILLNSFLPVGEYLIQWDGKNSDGYDTPSGTYFYRIRTQEYIETKKCLLLR